MVDTLENMYCAHTTHRLRVANEKTVGLFLFLVGFPESDALKE